MRILILDIETSPNLCWTWGLWKQNIAPSQVVKPVGVLCWVAKWYGEKPIFFAGENSHEREAMLEEIYELLNEADAVVHYNGTRFDMPILNMEFAKQGWEQPDPYKNIDLLKTVRANFRFSSNKLDFVAQELGLGKKAETGGMSLWLQCMEGDQAAWKKMEKYNRQDVALTEDLYDELKGWIKSHPNHALYVDDSDGRPTCTNCGSHSVIKKGIEATASRTYRRYKCNTCGHPMRGKNSLVRDDSGKWVERSTDSGELR